MPPQYGVSSFTQKQLHCRLVWEQSSAGIAAPAHTSGSHQCVGVLYVTAGHSGPGRHISCYSRIGVGGRSRYFLVIHCVYYYLFNLSSVSLLEAAVLGEGNKV